MATIMGFGWYKLLGLGKGDAAFDFWFPYGMQSLVFTCIALASDIVEDSLVHVMVNRAAKRHEPVCHYSRVIPGWLTDPVQASHAWRMVAAIQWVPAMITQFAFALRELGWL